MENTEEIVQSVSPQIVYEQDKAAIDIQISTAKAYPRNIRRATENALAIVTMDAAIAQTCTYSVPRGGKKVSGPSVHLAKIIAQVWGNMRIDAKVVDIDQARITSESVCWDLESNLAIKVQVKRSITSKTGRFSEDMITVTGNAANSIALRNAVLSVIPKGIVDKVYGAAKQTITGDISDKNKLIAKRVEIFGGLRDAFGITDKEILSAIGKAAIDFVDGDDLVTLVGVGQAIRDGDTTIDQAFKGIKTDATEKPDKEAERIVLMIKDAKTVEELQSIAEHVKEPQLDLFTVKMDELKAKTNGTN